LPETWTTRTEESKPRNTPYGLVGSGVSMLCQVSANQDGPTLSRIGKADQVIALQRRNGLPESHVAVSISTEKLVGAIRDRWKRPELNFHPARVGVGEWIATIHPNQCIFVGHDPTSRIVLPIVQRTPDYLRSFPQAGAEKSLTVLERYRLPNLPFRSLR